MVEADPEQLPRARRTSRVLARATTVYSVLVLTALVLSLLGTWLATAFDALLHLVLAPAPVLAVVAGFHKQWKSAAGLLVATAYLAWCCGGWLLPAPAAMPQSSSDSLVVLTWNLGLETSDPAEVAREVLRTAPDVALFQEASLDQSRELFEALRSTYPYREHFPHGLFSKAYVSRIEPISAQLVTPETTKNFLELAVPFGDATLTLTSMHTNKGFAVEGQSWPGYVQMLQQIRLAALRPMNLVVGDFNLTERNAAYREIRATGLIDSYRELHTDPGFTFPTFGRYRKIPLPPLLRIDYIWHTKDLLCHSIERTKPAQSDHCGLVARFSRR